MNNGYGNKTIKVVMMKFLGLQISCMLSSKTHIECIYYP
jgi:hypothetical protein